MKRFIIQKEQAGTGLQNMNHSSSPHKLESSSHPERERIPLDGRLLSGDPYAIEGLRDMLSAKSILFKRALEELKEEIYTTLKNYPYKDIKDLIDEGLKSRNQYIKEESLRLKKAAII
ncbi:MAG: hypothetical protein AB1638_00390 [Nitrospirota bacterium]